MTLNDISFEDFKNAQDRPFVDKEIPGKGKILIYKLTFKERLDFDLRHTDGTGTMNIRTTEAMADLIQMCVYTTNEQKLFDNEEKRLSIPNLEGSTLSYLFSLCVSENYISSSSVEDLEKNL